MVGVFTQKTSFTSLQLMIYFYEFGNFNFFGTKLSLGSLYYLHISALNL